MHNRQDDLHLSAHTFSPCRHTTNHLTLAIHVRVNNTFSISWIDRLHTVQSLIHDNSAHTTAEVIYECHKNNEDDSADQISHYQDSPNDQSVMELMKMTYSEFLPEDTVLPVAQISWAKSKYQCPCCRNKVWGKPEMNIICADYNQSFVPIS